MSINAIRTNEIAYKVLRVIDRGPGGSWCNNCPEHHWKYYFHYIWMWTWGFDNYNCAGEYISWTWGNNCNFCQSHSGYQITTGCDAMGTEGKDCTLFGTDPYCCGLRSTTTCRGGFYYKGEFVCGTCGSIWDMRTDYMKEHKCCPGALPD